MGTAWICALHTSKECCSHGLWCEWHPLEVWNVQAAQPDLMAFWSILKTSKTDWRVGSFLPLFSGAGQKFVLQARVTGGFCRSRQLEEGRPCCTQWTDRVWTPPPQVTVHCRRGKHQKHSAGWDPFNVSDIKERVSRLHDMTKVPADKSSRARYLRLPSTIFLTWGPVDLIRRVVG